MNFSFSEVKEKKMGRQHFCEWCDKVVNHTTLKHRCDVCGSHICSGGGHLKHFNNKLKLTYEVFMKDHDQWCDEQDGDVIFTEKPDEVYLLDVPLILLRYNGEDVPLIHYALRPFHKINGEGSSSGFGSSGFGSSGCDLGETKILVKAEVVTSNEPVDVLEVNPKNQKVIVDSKNGEYLCCDCELCKPPKAPKPQKPDKKSRLGFVVLFVVALAAWVLAKILE